MRRAEVTMVDVSGKAPTMRTAVAKAVVRMRPSTRRLLRGRRLAKGDALAAARLAGVMAAKQTSLLIPLCHPLPLEHVGVEVAFPAREGVVDIRATVTTTAKTGVEMEALAAAAGAALTLYDMAKAVDRGMTIEKIQLLAKAGGRSGLWRRTR